MFKNFRPIAFQLLLFASSVVVAFTRGGVSREIVFILLIGGAPLLVLSPVISFFRLKSLTVYLAEEWVGKFSIAGLSLGVMARALLRVDVHYD